MTVFQISRLLACSVCFAADQQSRSAYYLATGLLLVAPILLLGGLITWVAGAASSGERGSADPMLHAASRGAPLPLQRAETSDDPSLY